MDNKTKLELLKALKVAKAAVPIALIILATVGVLPEGGDEDPEDPALF